MRTLNLQSDSVLLDPASGGSNDSMGPGNQ